MENLGNRHRTDWLLAGRRPQTRLSWALPTMVPFSYTPSS